MPEEFGHNEHIDTVSAEAERAAVCADCVDARVGLNAELTPEQLRAGEITDFVTEHYPDCADVNGVVQACLEQEAAMSFMPGFDVLTDEAFVSAAVEKVQAANNLTEAFAVLDSTEETFTAVSFENNVNNNGFHSLVEHSEQEAERDESEETRAKAETRRDQLATAKVEDTQERLADADKLEADYNALREGGASQKDALQQLLHDSDNPEHQDRITQILGNISTLENALPGKGEAIGRLIEASNLDIGAVNSAAVFADFFANAEASGDFTEAEIATLKQSIGADASARNASQAREALAAGRGTETLPDGTTRTIPYTEEAPLTLADGVEAFPDPENPGHMKIKARFDDNVLGSRTFTFNCPENMSGSEATEQINFFYINAIKESCGITGGTQQGDFVTQGDAEINLSKDLAMTQAARFGRITMDDLVGGVGNETEFLDAAQIQQVRWGFQWLMPRTEASGDAAYGNNDERARAEFLGGNGNDGIIFDAQGNLKEANYRKAALYINQQAGTGTTEPSYEALKAYLQPNQAAEAMV